MIRKPDFKVDALLNIAGDCKFSLVEDSVYWECDNPPTEAEIQAEITRLQAEYDANQYQRDRASEYPSIEDQLDDLFHNGIEGWKTSIQAVKDKYPKE